MKKSIYFALAVASLALFACNSKPANSEEQAEEQVETTLEQAEEFVEEALEAGEPEVSPDETGETLAEEGLKEEEAKAEEAPAAEEPAAEEQPAEEPAKEKAKAEEPATPSDKFPIDRSDGNFVTLLTENVTANADGCIEGDFVFDKKEESRVRLIVKIETVEGSNIGVFPVAVEPGGTKGHLPMCASQGGVFSKITPGEKYKLSIVRAMRL